MSGRRAKQLRYAARKMVTGFSGRGKVRTPRMAPCVALLGWSDDARRVRLNHDREYERRVRQLAAGMIA